MSVTTLSENIAIVVGRGLTDIVYCTCGKTTEVKGDLLTNTLTKTCPSCEAPIKTRRAFIPDSDKIKLSPTLEVVSKSDGHFHIRKSTVYLLVERSNDNIKLTAKRGRFMELEFSFRTGEFILRKSRKEVRTKSDYELLSSFSSGLEQSEIIAAAATENSGYLFNYVLNEYGKRYGELTGNFIRGLTRYLLVDKHGMAEKMILTGFGKFIQTKAGERRSSFFEAEKIQEIFGVEKRHLPYVKLISDVNSNAAHNTSLRTFNLSDEKVSWNVMKAFYDYALDYASMEEIIDYPAYAFSTLVSEYGYNPKRLATYLCRELRLLQGISDVRAAARLLVDYNKMMRELGEEPDKYTRNLKKEHDLASMNITALGSSANDRKFSEVSSMTEYTDLVYGNEEFSIVLPTSPMDLHNEGTYLTHCVAGYINDVVEKRCKIVFLRRTELKNMSLVTVEIRGVSIVQASGFDNRKLTKKEYAFINEWADKKGLRNALGGQ